MTEKEGRKFIARRRLVGQRLTAQRRLLLELLQRQEGHLDADELYRLAKEREPRLSLSTVYRTLRLFKQLGLVEELHFAEDHHHYEERGRREHYHLLCLGCGKVIEFESPWIPQIKRSVSEEHDFKISSAEIHLAGYCPRCQQARPEAS